MHRLLMGFPVEIHVDHINGDKLDNRRVNLRLCTRSENAKNSKKPIVNSSGYKGVFKVSPNRWQAKIKSNGIQINLGSFSNKIDAAKAYNVGAIKYHGEFARINEIP